MRKRKMPAPSEPAVDETPTADDERQWTGFRDDFGEREPGVDEHGRAVEMLRMPLEFLEAREAISDRIVRLADVHRASLAQAFRLEDDGGSGRLILVSERVPGIRLSELLARASDNSLVPDLPAALFVVRRLLSIGRSVQALARVPHLAIAPERVVITPRGDVVVVEAALAAAIDVRRGFETNARCDIAPIAIAGLSLILGRAVSPDLAADARDRLLGEVADVAGIRVGEPFAAALRSWFEQALGDDAGSSFAAFDEAAAALDGASRGREDGSVALRRTLRAFLLEVEDFPDDAAGIEAERVRCDGARVSWE